MTLSHKHPAILFNTSMFTVEETRSNELSTPQRALGHVGRDSPSTSYYAIMRPAHSQGVDLDRKQITHCICV